ncbi:site-specific integrase [Mycolicibacterium hippocampi]|uniref:Integrase n=1 Tax=Mycolicibacterium hippocampi TaxID=659824 RepID=A0A850PVP6_9MYCO|nr:site-specific integrase [Mycolicibacterium hippocampi]NVN51685.1 Integrase [Mycolicibacterium hippocampi]
MTADPQAKRTRRAEPITLHEATNGTKSYWFVVDTGTRPDGSRDRQRFTYRTKAEAQREYRRITTEVASGTYVRRHRVTVAEFLTEWLDSRRKIRPVTLAGYRHALKPVVEHLGSTALQHLETRHVDELVTLRLNGQPVAQRDKRGKRSAEVLDHLRAQQGGATYGELYATFGNAGIKALDRLVASGDVLRPKRGHYVAARPADEPRPKVAGGVSARTVVTMLVVFSSALDDAAKRGLVVRNVARLVDRPKLERREMATWTLEQAATFRKYVRADRLHACWLLTLAGLRRSEVLGLRWADVSLDAATITVAQGRVVVPGEGTMTGDPKSHRSRRILPMPTDVMAALRGLKASQAAERLAFGEGYADTGLVAVNADGSPIRPETYSGDFSRLAKAAGVPAIRLHDVRHTAATVMLGSGTDVATAAKWLGHDPAMTLRVYAHPQDSSLASAGAVLFGATPKSLG